MSIGGFQAIVKINKYKFGCGFDDKGEPCMCADMELEGFLVEFTFGKPPEKWSPHGKKNDVSLNIEFRQQQEIDYWHWHSEQDKKYIGNIKVQPVGATTPDERGVNVWITLPYDMFFQICSVRERDIIFDTIHDLITEPNEDGVVALIKRVYFSERLWWYKQDSKTKRWWKPG